jgi:hypothetical protein
VELADEEVVEGSLLLPTERRESRESLSSLLTSVVNERSEFHALKRESFSSLLSSEVNERSEFHEIKRESLSSLLTSVVQ